MNKQDLISKIKQLDGVTQDERAYLINLVNTKKKYGLVWEDKPEDVEEQLRENLPILREVVEKRILAPSPLEKAGDEAPNHILIEGDNLHALTALTFTHEGEIDVIYIDPPYNTGNKDFKYNDTFVDKEDSYRHSKWLSFMDKRLRIAKRLLSEKGVIFISIDDNELANLKIQCDEVFGESNYCGLITRKQSSGSKNDMGNSKVITTTDYILPYKKDVFTFIPYQIKNNKKFNLKDEISLFSIRALEMQGGGDTLPQRTKMGYSVYYDIINHQIELLFDYNLNEIPVYEKENEILISKGYKCFRPRKRGNEYGRWRWGAETFIEKFNNKMVYFDGNRVYMKERETEFVNKYPEALFDDFLNTQGTNELKEILGHKSFDFPKPLELIKFLFKVSSNYDATILDFFAGSGTTLHATMALNAEDGGNRQCILVTNNENNICEEVTYERNKRVIEGYINAKGIEVMELKNNNLRYYKADYVSRTKSLKNKKELTRLATELLCIKEDCYTPSTIVAGTKQSQIAVFEDAKKQMVVIYDDVFIEVSIAIIMQLQEQKQNNNRIKVYVFSNGQYPYNDDFDEVAQYVELCALPDAIYKAYKNVLPKTKREVVPTLEEDSLGENQDLFTANT